MMDGMTVPALLQGLNGRQVAAGIAGVNDDEDGVFYDELSYPPQFRAPNHPPAYEVKLRASTGQSLDPCLSYPPICYSYSLPLTFRRMKLARRAKVVMKIFDPENFVCAKVKNLTSS